MIPLGNLDTPLFRRAERDRFIRAAVRAKKFVFSDSAARLVGRFAAECDDLILENWQFAIPPFEACYIEFPCDPFFERFEQTTARKPSGELDPDRDERHGFLIDGPKIYSAASSKDRWGVSPMITRHGIPPGYVPFDVGPKDEKADWNKLAALLGSSVHRLDSEEQRQAIVSNFHFEWAGDTGDLGRKAVLRFINADLQHSAGYMRNLWACLLWLNQPSHVRKVQAPASARLIKGKRVAYSAHTVIEIDLADKPFIASRMRGLLGYQRASPVGHDVRGFFRHRHGDQNCSHAWPLMPDDDGHWECPKCGRLRFWVKEHQRGDSSRGRNENQYQVTVEHK